MEQGDTFDDELGTELKATSHTGVIRGVVVDPTITPIAGATIKLAGTDHAAVSNDLGVFGFGDIEPGVYFITAAKLGYNGTQSSTTVEAGIDNPPIIKIMLNPAPGTLPFIIPFMYNGYLACGAAVVATSVGCTTWGPIADLTSSESIWRHEIDTPTIEWTQGELVWDHNQAGGGMFIWEIVQGNYPGTPQPHIGYRETGESPALAYLDNDTVEEYRDWILEEGIDYRVFAGPHPACTGVGFGCGVTIDQEMTAYVHDFYNLVPTEGWRFTFDGDHPLPV